MIINIIKPKKHFLVKVLNILVYLLPLSFFVYHNYVDYDTWWHISLGKNYLETGSQISNLTYTCQNYDWKNYSLLGSVFIYILYQLGGFGLLNLLVAIIFYLGTLVNFFTIKKLIRLELNRFWLNYFLFVLLCIVSSTCLYLFRGVRPQIFSYFFVSLLFFFLVDRYYLTNNTKSKLKLIEIISLLIIFILWVNIHGSFVIGILILVIFIIKQILEIPFGILNNSNVENIKLYISKLKQLSFLLCLWLFVSLINFHGILVWPAILEQIFSGHNHSYIEEWTQLRLDNYSSLIYFVLSLLGIFFVGNFKNLFFGSLIILSTILSLLVARNVLPFLTINVIIVFVYFINFLKDYICYFKQSIHIYKKFFSNFKILFLFVLLIIFLYKIYLLTTEIDLKDTYPVENVNLIKSMTEFKNIKFFNEYGWGGYLSYALPEYLWFIDGRMPAWKCTGVAGYIMDDYVNLYYLNNKFQDIISHYQIKGFLVNKNSFLKKYLDTQTSDWIKVGDDNVSSLYIKNYLNENIAKL